MTILFKFLKRVALKTIRLIIAAAVVAGFITALTVIQELILEITKDFQ